MVGDERILGFSMSDCAATHLGPRRDTLGPVCAETVECALCSLRESEYASVVPSGAPPPLSQYLKLLTSIS